AGQLGGIVHHLNPGRFLHRSNLRHVDTRDLREDVRRGLGDVLRLAEAVGIERFNQHLGDSRQRAERSVGELAHLLHPRLAVDVQLPAGELGGEPHVLAAPADRQGKLIIRNDELHRVVRLVDDDPRHLGRGERGADEARRVLVVRDDVDLFAAQLLNDRLDPAPFHSHAGPYWIDVLVARGNGDLRPATRLAGGRLDQHNPLGYLGNLHLEQLGQQIYRGAGENNLRTL